MRLLHSTTLQFEEFFDSKIPPYIILSHRWEGKEVSFQTFNDDEDKSGPEYGKIRSFCSPAAAKKVEWVWIYTCCIDKKSSAELSEAINSMYRWYEQADRCYAYLADVRWVEDNDDEKEKSRKSFRESLWFTRGWTLRSFSLRPLWSS
jgi:hypothetical protein